MSQPGGFGFKQQPQGSFAFGKGFQNTVTTTSATSQQPFGTWQNPQQQQSSFGFGQQTPSAFPTPSQTPFGGFGAQAQAQTQTPQAGPSNAFGTANSSPFGFSQPTGGYGFQAAGPSAASGFGFSSSQAGSSTKVQTTFGFNTQPFPGPSNAPSQAPSSVQNIDPRLTGTREPKFEPYKDREPSGAIQIFQNLTAMEPFRPWSSEELRLYDYELNRRPGVQQSSLVAQPSQTVTSTPSAFPFQQPQQPQPQQQQPQQQPQPQFAQSFNTPFAQPPAAQPQFGLNLQPQTPATIGALNPYNYQRTGSLYYRLHGTNNPPPLVFETKLKPKVDKGKGKEFILQPQQPHGTIGPPNALTGLPSVNVPINDISKVPQIQKSTIQVPTFPLSAPSAFQTMTTAQVASTPAPKIPVVKIPTVAVTSQPAITTGPKILPITGSSNTKEKPKERDSDDEYEDLFPENKTRTTPLPPGESKKILTEADFPRRKRREPIYHTGVLTLKDIKEPTWGYDKSYRRTVPKIHNVGNSEKNLLEQLKIRDRYTTAPRSLTNTTEANKKKVPGSEVPPESDVEARLVYELLLKPRRDGPYAYRGEYDGTWSPLYGDGRDEKPKWEPIKWKQQKYYKEYVKDVKRTKFPITEERYEAPSWWDSHPYKPVPKELTKDMDQYDLSHEAFVEDIVVKMGLRPNPPKAQIDALNRQVIVKIVRVHKKPAEWTETKLVNEPSSCCGAMVQKYKDEKMSFNKLYNPLVGGFESQLPNQPWVFVYAALPGEFEDRTPSYAELLNKYKAGIPQRNMYILDEPPRMPRVDFSKIIEGEIEFAKIVKEDVHKICHQDKKCDCPYAKKEPEIKQAQTIPRSHFYCYDRLGKKPREDKPTTFQRVHGYQPFSKNKTPEPEENHKPTKIHRILVPPQDDEF